MTTETWKCAPSKALDADCPYGGTEHGCGHWEVWVEIEDDTGSEYHNITRDTTPEYAQRICDAMNGTESDPWAIAQQLAWSRP